MSLKKISISLDSFVQKQTLHTSIERQFGSVQLNLLCVYSVGKLTLKTMLVCVWLVSSLIHMISGCVLSGSKTIDITGFTGDSLVLPCACTNEQKKPEWIRWIVHPGGPSTVIFSQSPPSVNDRYKHRVQVLDSISPGNLSLRLSDLTLSDRGTYRCEADGHYRDISLTVEACVLSDSEPIHITGFTGDSVVLPCACIDVQKKPEQVKWTAHTGGQSTVIFPQSPPSVNDRYKHRVQVLDPSSPGNLSLRLSDLTLSDEGTYSCEASRTIYRDIILTVKGCVLSGSKPIDITVFTGDSVVLPCACTNVQRKPERVKWTAHTGGQSTVIFPPSVNDRYKHRVQVLDSISSGILSLRLSDLTLSDEGTYRCEADGHYSDISLTVKGCSLSAPTEVTGYTGGSVVLPCYCTEGQPTLNNAKWFFHHGSSYIELWSYPTTVDDHYKYRVIISATPGNLSLRLSDLTLSDEGTYRCEADGQHRDIRLTVKGCVLSDSEPIDITGFTEDSVILPCACTDVQRKPGLIKWTAYPGGQSTVIFPQSPPSVNDRYKHRVQVLDSVSLGNLSVRLSDLTLSDGGPYRCEADGQHRDISLTVKGCSLSAPTEVTGYTGGSVVLPCYCTEGQPIPNNPRWLFQHDTSYIELWLNHNTGNDRYKDRVIVSKTPGNLSLSLSGLTLSDGGTYSCEADEQRRVISLTVKGCVLSDSEPIHITGFTGDSVILPCACIDVQRKPERVKWTAHPGGQSTVIFPQSPPNDQPQTYHQARSSGPRTAPLCEAQPQDPGERQPGNSPTPSLAFNTPEVNEATQLPLLQGNKPGA
ncbi:hemicentin-1-like [Anguilla anguilla]|uniref:hemicentin-1-like n=1 Tax=Anguilla anguilla TaxID=7936 RepID=UPI0015AC3753|nr:hemicentin-1-like [Anguilla anguilla]